MLYAVGVFSYLIASVLVGLDAEEARTRETKSQEEEDRKNSVRLTPNEIETLHRILERSWKDEPQSPVPCLLHGRMETRGLVLGFLERALFRPGRRLPMCL